MHRFRMIKSSKILFIVFVLFAPVAGYGQIRSFERAYSDVFTIYNNNFLLGEEDLECHPSRIHNTSEYQIDMNSRFHDIYRERVGDRTTSLSQFDVGIDAKVPLSYFNKNFFLQTTIEEEHFSYRRNSSYRGIDYTGIDLQTISFKNILLFQGESDNIGFIVAFNNGTKSSNVTINEYPSPQGGGMEDTYFYNLLEPAFGKYISFELERYIFEFGIEYTRDIDTNLNIGFQLHRTLNDYPVGIQYLSRVEQIGGEKQLDGGFRYEDYTMGGIAEYRFYPFVFRARAGISLPDLTLDIHQNTSIQSNNVNLEMLRLLEGGFKGTGYNTGLGLTAFLTDEIKASASYAFIKRGYSGQIFASTPVLGFEILPIAHQLDVTFEDNMNTDYFSLLLNHTLSETWEYSFRLEYFTSANNVLYTSKILTEFGIGNNKEDNKELITADCYSLGLQTRFNVMNNIGLNISFDQIIPVLNQERSGVEQTIEPPPASGQNELETSKWGGSLYSISLYYHLR